MPIPPTLATRGGEAKRSYVRRMFTAIAPRYDLLNHVLSLNLDRRWRRRAVDRLEWGRHPAGTYLDLCAGTLDLAAELARRPEFRGRVVGVDFVVPMLQLGRTKGARIAPVGADALDLPFPDTTFHGCTVGFGIRNLADVEAGLRELARVLEPGARLVVLEFTTPKRWPIRPLYLFYFRRILPRIGRWVSKHRDAYEYLPNSVREFPEREGFGGLMASAGFSDVRWEEVTFGVAAIYVGVRQERQERQTRQTSGIDPSSSTFPASPASSASGGATGRKHG